MKKILLRILSVLLLLAMVAALIPAMPEVKAQAVTQNQKNIVDRANYFFDTTWVCQKTIYGWRDEFVFEEGETYRLPYAQPVNSGKFIGYGVTLEDFLEAAADVNSVYYSKQSEFNGWTSAYYGTDCAAFVAMCWGTVRQDCSTLPYYSTNIGVVSAANLSKIQLGDALDSTTVGHVVLVTDLVYDDDGNLTQIEITEQTPPQLKRTVHTPDSLLEKYGSAFYIYRYYGEVPEAPQRSYTTQCDAMASHCDITITQDYTPIMNLPCDTSVDATSVQLQTAMSGDSYVATKLYRNTEGQLWYRVALGNKEGYVAAEATAYQGQILDDITLTGATAPAAHVRGKTFSVNGTLSSLNNKIPTASVYIYQGFGTGSNPITGDSDAVSSNNYALKNSLIDYNTSFGDLTAGPHTYAIAVDYENYYAVDGETCERNSGTLTLMESYFMVVNASVNQSTCAHSYTTTVVDKQTCTANGLSVKSCATCGLVEQVTLDAQGHSYGDWTENPAATCTEDGQRSAVCAACGDVKTQVIPATGHAYEPFDREGDCQTYPHTTYICGNCGHSYNVYPEEIMSDWQTELPDVAEELIESKTQYRFREEQTMSSTEPELEGCTQIASGWTESNTGTVSYVAEWPAGFDTSHSLYEQYNNIGSKVTASESETAKTAITGDKVAGYLYYHWCSATDIKHYSYSNKSNTHNIFHAYYSTTNPDTYTCDTSDMSYKTSDSCCANGNSEWFFVAKVYQQSYINYEKIYTYTYWGDWSEWSDECVEPAEGRQVEEQTLYRYATGPLGHSYTAVVTAPTCTEDGYTTYTCAICGDSYVADEVAALGHSWVEGTCTEAGYCERCGATGETLSHNYTAEVTAPTCTEAGYTTYTCSACGDSYVGEEVAALDHSWTDGICTECGIVCDHSWYDGTCVFCGYVCGHSWFDGICTVCNMACTHEYVDGICATCGKNTNAAPTACLRGDFNNWAYEANMKQVQDGMLAVMVPVAEKGQITFSLFYDGRSYGMRYGATPRISEEVSASYSEFYVDFNHPGNYIFYLDTQNMRLMVMYAPEAMYVRGSFNGWSEDVLLTDNGDGTFSATMILEPGSYEFEFTDLLYYSSKLGMEHQVLKKSYVTVYIDMYSAQWFSGFMNVGNEPIEEPVVVPALKLSYPTLAFEAEILYNAYFTVDDATDVEEF
ncbi:MAG: hypothetical protein IJB11_05850, partial [Oscillospiraceae bacterium]|nr:hypothetical protein [Oscillospiraceae bacterium]